MRRPAPRPPAGARPKRISVTRIDELARDPYHYYARAILRLEELQPLTAGASPAWRGSRVHALLEDWVRDGADPAALEAHIQALRDDPANDELSRGLWLPRIEPAIRWAAAYILEQKAAGRVTLAMEVEGKLLLDGVTLTGKADRIDRLPDRTLAVVDYKTGHVPSAPDVREGRNRQLGLLALIAAKGGMAGVPAETAFTAFEYWQLVPDGRGGPGGKVVTPFTKQGPGKDFDAAALLAEAEEGASALIADYLNGDAPFAPATDADAGRITTMHQLMRREEWFGREPVVRLSVIEGGKA